RHGNELPRSIKPHGFVSERSKVAEIAPGSAPEIKNRVGWVSLYHFEECRIILADIVVSRTFPEGSCAPIVIRNRGLAETPDLFRIPWFSRADHRLSILPIMGRNLITFPAQKAAPTVSTSVPLSEKCRRAWTAMPNFA